MTTRRVARRIKGDNVEQGARLQASIDPSTENVTNVDYWSIFQMMAPIMMTQDK